MIFILWEFLFFDENYYYGDQDDYDEITLFIQNLLQDTVWLSHSWSEDIR